MNQLNLVCLSLTSNLRCVGFTLEQFAVLIIPTAIEVIVSSFFIYLYSAPDRLAQVLLTADSTLYLMWALLDMLSRVVPAARISLSVFRALDFLVGAVSFTPIFLYSTYLYRLSSRNFVPALPGKLQLYPEILIPILLVVAVAMNELSSFIGMRLGAGPKQPVVVQFSHDSESLWLSLSQFSLTIYTIIQFLFFLLAFCRLSRAFLERRRIELAQSGEQHHFNGIAWITIGILVGVIETIAGFARICFGVALARRILHLVARATLMFGLFKGLDIAESFENLTDELHGVSRITRHISRMFGVNPQQNMFRRISQSHSEQSEADECSTTKKQSRDQRVTVHYDKGQAPFLQIRFSLLDFSTQGSPLDTVEQRRKSLSGLISEHARAGPSSQQHGECVLDDMTTARNTILGTPRAKSALVTSGNNHHVPPDWMGPPKRIHARQGSGETISDSLSIVRDLERRFPNLPPRVTGKYRGSILGQNYEEDPYPVVGVSRQSSLRQDGGIHNPSEEGGATVTLSPSGSIKRKPAPPLLESIPYISERRRRPASTWGGLTQSPVNYPADSIVVPNSPFKGSTEYSPDPTLVGEPSTPKPRKTTARDVIKRVSRALSDASIRSAEWLASASSPRSARTPLTAMDIEMYRRGTLGPGSARLASGVGEASSGEKASRRSADDAILHPKPNRRRSSTGL